MKVRSGSLKKPLAPRRKGVQLLRLDPSRTSALRRSLRAELKRRFARLRMELYELIVREDVFGLSRGQTTIAGLMRPLRMRGLRVPTGNIFCPTGPGGGVDPTCSPGGIRRTGWESVQLPHHNSWKELPAEEGYYYHATNRERAEDISRSELKPHKPWHGTDQSGWPDGSTARRSYFSNRPATAWMFAPEEGQPALLRVRREAAEFRAESTGDIYTRKKIQPNSLEVLTTKGWANIARLAGKPTANTRWQLHSLPEKVRAFRDWLQQRLNELIVKDEHLWQRYVTNAYQRGVIRSYDESRKGIGVAGTAPLPGAFGRGLLENAWKGPLAPNPPTAYQAGRNQFLSDVLHQPSAMDALRLLITRSFEGIKAVADAVMSTILRRLADLLLGNSSSQEIAGELLGEVDRVGTTRAEAVAHDAIVRAQAEGQLEGFTALGIGLTEPLVEWRTSGLKRTKKGFPSPCPRCKAMEGVVMNLDQAHGLIPYHPGCLCSWKAVAGTGLAGNIFCPTGKGGGVDPTCSPTGQKVGDSSYAKKVDLSGIQDTALRERIDSTLGDLSRKYGLRLDEVSLGMVEKDQFDEASAAYLLTVELGPKGGFRSGGPVETLYYLNLDQEVWRNKSSLKAYRDRLPAGYLADPSAAGMLRHEFAHALEKFHPESRGLIQEVYLDYKKTGGMVSIYSIFSPREMTAEAFSYYLRQGSLEGTGLERLIPLFKSWEVGNPTKNIFCPTGPGGGIDPTCSPRSSPRAKAAAVKAPGKTAKPSTALKGRQEEGLPEPILGDGPATEHTIATDLVRYAQFRGETIRLRFLAEGETRHKELEGLQKKRDEALDKSSAAMSRLEWLAKSKGPKKLVDEAKKALIETTGVLNRAEVELAEKRELAVKSDRESLSWILNPPGAKVHHPDLVLATSVGTKIVKRAWEGGEFLGSLVRAHGELPEGWKVGVYETSSSRDYFEIRPEKPSYLGVHLRKDTNTRTAVHELGHSLENVLPGAQAAARSFLEYRTTDATGNREKITLLNTLRDGKAFEPMEAGYRDHFDKVWSGSDAYYVGKVYWFSKNTEILSMGLEKLYTAPRELAEWDPEYFHFLCGVLDGSLRTRK